MAADFSSQYEIRDKLGRGSFGSVFKVVSRQDGNTYALKIFEVPENEFEGYDFMREVYVMMALGHPNILKFYKPVRSKPIRGLPSRTGILVEHCPGGDMDHFIKERNGRLISPQRMLKWMKELSSAVAYLHEKLILHRDLKPSNVFLDAKESLKVGDFGVSKVLDSTFAGTVIGSPIFMAPEVFQEQYDEKADIYSLGCIFLCLASVKCLPRNPNGTFIDTPPTSVFGEAITNTIESCLNGNSKKRPDAESIVHIVNEEQRNKFPVLDAITVIPKCKSKIIPQNVTKIASSAEDSLKLHTVHGTNIRVSEDKAERVNEAETQGLLFSDRPVNPVEEVTFDIDKVTKEQYGLLTFGFTSVDPRTLENRVPESIPKLDAFKESWIVHRYEMIRAGTKISFHYNERGQIYSTCKGREKYRQENLTVNPGTSVWATFNMSSQFLTLKIINISWTGPMKLESVIGHPMTGTGMSEELTSPTGTEHDPNDVFDYNQDDQIPEEHQAETSGDVVRTDHKPQPNIRAWISRQDSVSSDDTEDNWSDDNETTKQDPEPMAKSSSAESNPDSIKEPEPRNRNRSFVQEETELKKESRVENFVSEEMLKVRKLTDFSREVPHRNIVPDLSGLETARFDPPPPLSSEELEDAKGVDVQRKKPVQRVQKIKEEEDKSVKNLHHKEERVLKPVPKVEENPSKKQEEEEEEKNDSERAPSFQSLRAKFEEMCKNAGNRK